MPDREFDQGTIPGSDVIMSGYQEIIPLNPPQPEGNEWKRKTDWAVDGIIANEPG